MTESVKQNMTSKGNTFKITQETNNPKPKTMIDR